MNQLACNSSTSGSISAVSYDFTAITLGRKEVANAAWAPSAAKRAEVAAKRSVSYDFTAITLGRKEVANAAWTPSLAKRIEVAAKRAAAVQ